MLPVVAPQFCLCSSGDSINWSLNMFSSSEQHEERPGGIWGIFEEVPLLLWLLEEVRRYRKEEWRSGPGWESKYAALSSGCLRLTSFTLLACSNASDAFCAIFGLLLCASVRNFWKTCNLCDDPEMLVASFPGQWGWERKLMAVEITQMLPSANLVAAALWKDLQCSQCSWLMLFSYPQAQANTANSHCWPPTTHFIKQTQKKRQPPPPSRFLCQFESVCLLL